MSNFLASLSSFLRSVISVAILGIVTVASWFGYRTYQEHYELDAEVKRKSAQFRSKPVRSPNSTRTSSPRTHIAQLDMAVRLLKVDRRLAEIVVLEQSESKPTGKQMTQLQFTEVDDAGRQLDKPKVVTIEGDTVYIDAWVIKYADQYVEKGDPLRATSVCLFRRIFGEHQEPAEGFPLDSPGSRPAAYARGANVGLRARDWSNFWDYANNPRSSERESAPHTAKRLDQGAKGKVYKVELRSSRRTEHRGRRTQARRRGRGTMMQTRRA